MEKTKGGYMFPGIDPNMINEALIRRKSNFKPALPQVRATSMDSEG